MEKFLTEQKCTKETESHQTGLKKGLTMLKVAVRFLHFFRRSGRVVAGAATTANLTARASCSTLPWMVRLTGSPVLDLKEDELKIDHCSLSLSLSPLPLYVLVLIPASTCYYQ